VLLVDDDERMRELVRIELEREGYDVQEAASAEEGLTAIETRRPELVLLDVMMPHVDGWEMLRQIQERHGVGAIPVLMFSGQVDAEARRQAASSGARGFVGQAVRPRRARRADEGDRSGLAGRASDRYGRPQPYGSSSAVRSKPAPSRPSAPSRLM
jgi:CheY-like chemotaxis protein